MRNGGDCVEAWTLRKQPQRAFLFEVVLQRCCCCTRFPCALERALKQVLIVVERALQKVLFVVERALSHERSVKKVLLVSRAVDKKRCCLFHARKSADSTTLLSNFEEKCRTYHTFGGKVCPEK